MLFVSSKVSQLALLPQGRVEAARRVKNMIAKMDELGRLNREMIKAKMAD